MTADKLSAQPLEFLKLMSHELRWQIITTLIHSDYRVQELIDVLQQPQNLVSYHLKQLRHLRVITERRSTADARDIYYSVDLVQLQRFYDAVGEALHPALRHREPATAGLERHPQLSARILFLCTENSARSQMAEGILRHASGNAIEVFSAGTEPSTIHAYAIRALAELGIDISQQRAKSVNEFQGQTFDYVITVCDRARENCPVFTDNAQFIHWSLSDPAAVADKKAHYEAFQHTAQQLQIRIHYLLAQLDREK